MKTTNKIDRDDFKLFKKLMKKHNVYCDASIEIGMDMEKDTYFEHIGGYIDDSAHDVFDAFVEFAKIKNNKNEKISD